MAQNPWEMNWKADEKSSAKPSADKKPWEQEWTAPTQPAAQQAAQPSVVPTFDPNKNITMGDSAAQGLESGLAAGWNDEYAGARNAVKNGLFGNQSIVDAYTTARDQVRAADKAAYNKNPISYATGNMSGALALQAPSTAVPGVGNAIMGAIQGLGNSEGSFGNQLAGTALGAATAGVGGKLATNPGVQQSALTTARWLFQKLASGVKNVATGAAWTAGGTGVAELAAQAGGGSLTNLTKAVSANKQ